MGLNIHIVPLTIRHQMERLSASYDFKEAICRDSLPLAHRLQSFLLTCRSTTHATTGRAPCELFLGRKVKARLDLLRPSVEENVLQRQAQQKGDHDRHARYREFEVGQKVMVKGRRPGSVCWIPGHIINRTGPLTYLVDMGEDVLWRCHVDQLKACLESAESGSDSAEFEYDLNEEEACSDDPAEPTPEPKLLSEPQVLTEEAAAPPSQPAEGSPINPELDTQWVVPATMDIRSHKYPLRDRKKHQRF